MKCFPILHKEVLTNSVTKSQSIRVQIVKILEVEFESPKIRQRDSQVPSILKQTVFSPPGSVHPLPLIG